MDVISVLPMSSIFLGSDIIRTTWFLTGFSDDLKAAIVLEGF